MAVDKDLRAKIQESNKTACKERAEKFKKDGEKIAVLRDLLTQATQKEVDELFDAVKSFKRKCREYNKALRNEYIQSPYPGTAATDLRLTIYQTKEFSDFNDACFKLIKYAEKHNPKRSVETDWENY
jgi:HEPN domain-containing protein